MVTLRRKDIGSNHEPPPLRGAEFGWKRDPFLPCLGHRYGLENGREPNSPLDSLLMEGRCSEPPPRWAGGRFR